MVSKVVDFADEIMGKIEFTVPKRFRLFGPDCAKA